MVFWRRKNEGFEWKEYVRTTILVRRKERRQRVEDVKAAAVFGVKQAGRSGAEAARDAALGASSGLAAASAGLWSGLKVLGARLASGGRAAGAAGAEAAGAAWAKSSAGLSRAAGAIRDTLGPRLSPVSEKLLEPGISLPLTILTWVSLVGGGWRLFNKGLDGETLLALGIGTACLLLTLGPRLLSGDRPRPLLRMAGVLDAAGEKLVLLPGLDRLSPRTALAGVMSAMAVVAAGTAWYRPGVSLTAALPALSLPAFETEKVEGRAYALSGDRLRIGETVVQLDGIEAPLPHQRCSKPGVRKWSCGETAKDALSAELRGRTVACEITGTVDEKTKLGRCRTKETDVAETLVRKGTVFAHTGFFARYATVEAEAQMAKVGLWAGEALRPGDWRTMRWDEAKTAAPGGCPIKGPVSSNGRTYVLPWAAGYDGVRIRETKGERWFCSEAEALAAGWRPPRQS